MPPTNSSSRPAQVAPKSAAQISKDQGNAAFKEGKYQLAVEHYTAAMKADPSDHILPCNRAMAHLKLEQWRLAEQDSTRSLGLLPAPNSKAYFRRGLARKGLKMWTQSIEDLEAALEIEPSNTGIIAQLKSLNLQLQAENIGKDTPTRDAAVPSESRLLRTSAKVPKDSSTGPTASLLASSQSSSSSSAASSLLADRFDGTPQPLHGNLIREISTKRFDHKNRPLEKTVTPQGPTNAFSALKQVRRKKEESIFPTQRPGDPHKVPHHSASITARASGSAAMAETRSDLVESSLDSVLSVASATLCSFAELERRWGMSGHPEARWSILKALDPKLLPTIFGEHLEPNFLDEIVEALKIPQRLGEEAELARALWLLEGLDRVSRLKTLTMFLEPDQKQVRNVLASYTSINQAYPRPPLTNWGL